MKIHILAHAYPGFLQYLYSTRPELSFQDYRAQYIAVDHECHFWGNSVWQIALRGLGYETSVAIANNEPMQQAWAVEHGEEFAPQRWLLDVSEAQIRRESPDILLITSYTMFPPEWLAHIRETYKRIKLIMMWCGAPFTDSRIFVNCDVVLSCIPELVARFRDSGQRAFHLNHAFDERVLNRISLDSKPAIDFSFIGQIILANQYHVRRAQILEKIAESVDIRIFTSSFENPISQYSQYVLRVSAYLVARVLKQTRVGETLLSAIPLLAKPAAWTEVPRNPILYKLARLTQPALFGLPMYQIMRNSKITFNSHIDLSSVSASNMRLFEATGVGTCLLTDSKANLSELFDRDHEIVAYESIEDCLEKIVWLLDHEDERNRIAAAGQKRTLRSHTFDARAPLLDSHIREALGAASGSAI